MLCVLILTEWAMKNGKKRIKTKAKIVATMSLVPYLFFFRLRLWLWHDISLRARIHKHGPTVAAIIVFVWAPKADRENGRTSIELHAYIPLNDCMISDLWTLKAHKKSLRVQFFFSSHFGCSRPQFKYVSHLYDVYYVSLRLRLSKAYWTVKRIWTKAATATLMPILLCQIDFDSISVHVSRHQMRYCVLCFSPYICVHFKTPK